MVELRCSWDPASWGGSAPDGRLVRGTLHWVPAAEAVPIETRLYDRLFSVENPGATEGRSFLDEVNPQSMLQLTSSLAEPYLAQAGAAPGARFQFERLGYFCLDPASSPARQIWNRTVTLKDSWAKIEARAGGGAQPAGAATGAGAKAGRGVKPGGKGRGEAAAEGGGSPAPIARSSSSSSRATSTTATHQDAEQAPEIGVDDLARIDLRVGIVREAAHVPEAQKLIRLMVDLGEGRLRQIFSGLRDSYRDAAALIGRRVVVVANLKPRKMKFGVSEGMILSAGGVDRPNRIATFDDEAGAADGIQSPHPGDKIT